VRQTRSTDHQRHGDEKHVGHRLAAIGVGGKAQLGTQPVETFDNALPGTANLAAKAQLRNRVAGDHHRHIDSRHHVGKDHHAVLCHLGIGDALHATEYGVEEHDRHADHPAGLDAHFQVAREDDTDATHLPGDVGEGDEDHADHGDQPCGLGVIALTNEV